MRKLFFILITLSVFALTAEAGIRWPFGNANILTGGTNDTLDISSELTSGLNYYIPDNDTSMLLNVTTVDDEWNVGDYLYLELTEGSADADTVRYGTNITGLETVVPEGKTKIVNFIWNGTAWVKVSETQID